MEKFPVEVMIHTRQRAIFQVPAESQDAANRIVQEAIDCKMFQVQVNIRGSLGPDFHLLGHVNPDVKIVMEGESE